MTRRAINLGCGKLTYPVTERPRSHFLEPDLFFDPHNDLVWDNVDRNPYPGVTILSDLFDYPWYDRKACPDCGVEVGQFHKSHCDWETVDAGLYVPDHNVPGETASLHRGNRIPDNTYDFALASHLVEHIPHLMIWEGKPVYYHPQYQDGWFAWFGELHRILKPGGRAYIIVPYGWSNSALADPTHVRYIIPATFGYFDAETASDTFTYQMNGQRWECNLTTWPDFVPHEQGLEIAKQRALLDVSGDVPDLGPIVLALGNSNINMVVEFLIKMDAIK